jgi:phosphoglycerate dehydrogenase-like enzyme
MLAFARQIPLFVRDQDRASWRGWGDAPAFFELGGQRVLCLGTGDIGQEVARRLASFGCEMIGASRSGYAVPGFNHCVSFDDLEAELALADHVVSSLPLTESTRQIYDRKRIGATKRGAYFYNVGRGGTVDQDALIEALKNGHLAGAGLDVVEPEPLPGDSPLWAMKNVIITGHTSGNSPQAMQRMADLAVEQLYRYQSGDDLLNVVDVTAGY